ncbi:MAG: hypothetical protein IPP72_20935 [Chitinophagaceae bacterium]|nr:hypothetical protein [Chitinophagaceae bacterium]
MQNFTIMGRFRFFLIDIIRGTSIIKVLKELRRQQFLPAEQLELIRQQKLDHLFKLAQSTTDYYSQFKSYHELPILTKDIITSNFNGIISRSFKEKLVRKTTGGSTAEPFAYYSTRQSQSYL